MVVIVIEARCLWGVWFVLWFVLRMWVLGKHQRGTVVSSLFDPMPQVLSINVRRSKSVVLFIFIMDFSQIWPVDSLFSLKGFLHKMSWFHILMWLVVLFQIFLILVGTYLSVYFFIFLDGKLHFQQLVLCLGSTQAWWPGAHNPQVPNWKSWGLIVFRVWIKMKASTIVEWLASMAQVVWFGKPKWIYFIL